MYETFMLIANTVINGMSYVKNFMETSDLLKEKVSRRDRDNLEKYILGESLKMKEALSREHMLSSGVSEKYVDVVIEEIRIFIPQVKITDEMRSRCGYQNMELADLLWCEYCRLNNKNKFEEYEHDLKKGLFVVAQAWNEPPEGSIRSCVEFLQRIDAKSSRILLDVKKVKSDTKDIGKDVKNTERKVEELNSGIGKLNGMAENTNDMVREIHQLIWGKGEEAQTAYGQKVYHSEGQEDSPEIVALTEESKQEAIDAEEISPDEIKICLVAAPDEFQDDIVSLQNFVEEQNCSQNAVHLNLRCYAGEAPQDIRNCKYGYILVGTKMEKWMQETYELAHRLNSDRMQDEKGVQLHMCFRDMSAKETVQADNGGREEWKDRYSKDYGRSPICFKNINRIELDILQNLRMEAPQVDFSTRAIIQFRNNEYFGKACRQRDDLQNQYREAGKAYRTSQSTEENKRIKALEEELKGQNEDINKMTGDIWDNLQLLTGKLRDNSTMDIREKEAIADVIEYGDYGKAEKILRSREWSGEITALEQSMKAEKEILSQFISSQRTLISNLKTKGISNDLENEIIEIYKRITALSKEWHIEYVTMYEFAEFLLNQRKYTDGIKAGEELKCLYGLSDGASDEERIRLLKLLGNLCYWDKQYERGERNYREALEIFNKGTCDNRGLRAEIFNELSRLLWKTNQLEQAEKGLEINIANLSKLVQHEPEMYEPVLAEAYNTRAMLANKRNQLDKAIEYHEKALEIRGRLAEKSTTYNYQPLMQLTHTYNNLGFVYKKKGEYEKAEMYYKKAIDIRSRNAKTNPSAFRPALALVYSNYATMLNLRGDNEKAQEICERAYAIRSEIVKEKPSYRVELAYTLHEYGIILTDAGEHMYAQAGKYFEEAIAIRESMADKDVMAYGVCLAETYCSYGKLLALMGDSRFEEQYYYKAEQMLQKACDICDKYAVKNKGFDNDKLSEIYYSFAVLLSERLQKYTDAETYYKKALEGYRYLTKQCKEVFEPKLNKTEEELTELQERI